MARVRRVPLPTAILRPCPAPWLPEGCTVAVTAGSSPELQIKVAGRELRMPVSRVPEAMAVCWWHCRSWAWSAHLVAQCAPFDLSDVPPRRDR